MQIRGTRRPPKQREFCTPTDGEIVKKMQGVLLRVMKDGKFLAEHEDKGEAH